jgi:hypothetical protein
MSVERSSLRSRLPAGFGALGAFVLMVAVAAIAALAIKSHSGGSGRGAATLRPTSRAAPADPRPASEPAVPPRPAITIGGPVGRSVEPGFVGFSIEFPAIRAYTGHDPAHVNPVLIQLIRNLTPDQAPQIRIGGDSTDFSWVPTAAATPPPYVRYSLVPGWFETTAALARALGAKLTVGLNLAANQPALAAAEARDDVRAFGSALSAFEIGNEPNVYDVIAAYHTPTGGAVTTRPGGYDYDKYLPEFTAIKAAVAPLSLAGPALAAGPDPTQGSWIDTMGSFLNSQPRVRALTIHRYPLRNCFVGPKSPQYPTIPHLLASYATVGLDRSVERWVAVAHAHGRRLRVDELNSVACRGKTGVSDTFAAGLWVLDALFGLARTGVDGVNLHTLPGTAYQLFAFRHAGGSWEASVPPVYYGLYMFAQAAPPGSRLLAIGGAVRGPQLSVWATRAPDGQVRAVVINKSPTQRQTVTLRAPAGWAGTGTVLRMRAPGVAARGGVTIGGASFGVATDTGVLPPVHTQTVTAKGGSYSLVIPSGSAALITFGRDWVRGVPAVPGRL